MVLVIKNAIVVNADKKGKEPVDICVEDGSIRSVGKEMKTPAGATVIDASGKLVFPGFIDMHVHLREPGREDKETIETGSRAAAKGGFTTVFCMPNTKPVIDNAMVVEGVVKEARRVGLIDIVPIGAITKGQKDEELTDMVELKNAGCGALSDDGKSVLNSNLMRMALQYAKMAGLLLIEHCQDPLLSHEGVMNEGVTSTVLGLKGDPAVSETVIVARDIELVRYWQTRLHFAHISLGRSVELIRRAKKDGIAITAEACPHHFSLTEEWVKTFNTDAKVNPPLRTAADVAAIKEAFKDGTIDCIATDHAPHTKEEKEQDFDHAPFGMIGLETAVGLVVSELVRPGIISWEKMAALMAYNPAQITGLSDRGVIKEGMRADITIIDPEKQWEVRRKDFVSKSKNSPFIGRELYGSVWATISLGKVAYQA